jgi:hypothetical protein
VCIAVYCPSIILEGLRKSAESPWFCDCLSGAVNYRPMGRQNAAVGWYCTVIFLE